MKRALIMAPIRPHPRIAGKIMVNEKKGRTPQTRGQGVERFGGIALLRCRPMTGRQHQMRIEAPLPNDFRAALNQRRKHSDH